MERVGERSPRRASILAVLAALSWLIGCNSVEAQTTLTSKVVYAGDRELPILGFVFEDSGPRILARGSGPPAAQPPVTVVTPGLWVVFADGWTRHLRMRRDGTLLAPDLGEDPALVPDGWEFSLGSGATLAWSTAEEDGSTSRAWLHVGNERRQVVLPASRARWASVDDSGRHAVIGLLDSTVLLDRTAMEQLRLPPAELGLLSRDGEQLALEHVLEGKSTVALIRTASGRSSYRAAEELLALAFDAPGTKLALVSRTHVRVLDLESSAAKELLDVPAPAGQEWRNAAFGSAGQLALGGIRDVRHARRRGREAAPVSALAKLVVEVRSPALETVIGEAIIEVTEWNSRSPELGFTTAGRLFVVGWPSGFEVLLP